MERNISVFEADVIMDDFGLYPAGCTKQISCSVLFIREERIATELVETDCGITAAPGEVLPLAGSAVANVLTVKVYDPSTGLNLWLSKASYDANHGQCNDCCVPLPTLATPVLEAVPGDTIVDLSWGAVANATNYVLEQDTDINFSAPTEIYNGALLLYQDTGLTNGTTYYYRIKAQATGYQDSEYALASAVPAP